MNLFIHLSLFLHLIRPFNLCHLSQTYHPWKAMENLETGGFYTNYGQANAMSHKSILGCLPFRKYKFIKQHFVHKT